MIQPLRTSHRRTWIILAVLLPLLLVLALLDRPSALPADSSSVPVSGHPHSTDGAKP